jgi:hypothetical protein
MSGWRAADAASIRAVADYLMVSKGKVEPPDTAHPVPLLAPSVGSNNAAYSTSTTEEIPLT